MEERAKSLALVGAGALFGSVTTIALLRFLTRNIQFFGIESQQKVSASYVVVIGLGGVGSHAASMLLRSGIGRLLLVDFDQITFGHHQSLHLYCRLLRSGGSPTAFPFVLKSCAALSLPAAGSQLHALSVRAGCEPDPFVQTALITICCRCGNLGFLLVNLELYWENNICTLRLNRNRLNPKSITQLKVSLSSLNRHAVATREDVGIPKAHCLKRHFSLIFPECHVDAKVLLYDASSEEEILSGDPDFVLDCIDNIDTKVRHRLRKDYGIEGGIPVVFSLEKPKAKLLPFKGQSGDEENPSDYQVVPGFRVRIIPVLGTIPAIFGQVMSSYVVTQLAGFEVQTEPLVNFDMDHYRVLHQRLIEHEELLYGTSMQVQVTDPIAQVDSYNRKLPLTFTPPKVRATVTETKSDGGNLSRWPIVLTYRHDVVLEEMFNPLLL
ncbi:NAD(P)-binding Rossmann-fold superfamily protein [Actinidia rufa]|uniref:NAD(P)-binding Rossmann-fold superfamily protein n=1 Tax=Actinidia rufa TaxID=165716 RepID=A0A7J0EMC7_9ERIC|nr:NAD(P)-binding Rossmann-fold superfamily protein [Actinidia rufa]